MAGDRIDYAADGAAAVEQRRGSFDHFEFFQIQNIYRFGVISRLKAERADSIPVFKDEHAISVKTSDHRPRCARSESTLGHTKLDDPAPRPVIVDSSRRAQPQSAR